MKAALMKAAVPVSLMLSAALAGAPALAEDKAATPGPDTVMATVNGTPYTLDLFRVFYTERMQQTGGQNTPAFQEQAFNEFLSMVVAAQQAQKQELDKNHEVQTALELQRLMILSNAALQTVAKDTVPTEDDLKQAYEQFKEQAKRTEYKARHILVDSKEKAEALIKKLDKAKGKGFEKLAKENSTGPTAEKGGDLGWFDARQMVKPFSDAISTMKPGTYTKEPVQTQFGWHVILLEDTRTAEPPSFDEAKPTLEAMVKRQKVADALSTWRKDAKVDLNNEVVKLKEEPQKD